MSTAFQSTPQIPPPPGGFRPGELAPLSESATEVRERQNQDKQKQVEFVAFDEWLANVSRWIEGINQEEEQERLRLIQKMRMFYAGRQVLHYSKTEKRWKDKKKPGDALYVDPVLPAFVDQNVSVRMKSRPKIKVTARASDRVDKAEAARYAQELYEDAARQIFGASARQREAKNLELSGETYAFLFFDPRADGTEVRVPVTEVRSVAPRHGVLECPNCAASTPLGGTEEGEAVAGQLRAGVRTCPECGYGKAEVVAAEPFQAEVVTGFKDVPAGDVRAWFPDPLSVKVVGASNRIAEALTVTWDSLVCAGVLQAEYKDVAIPAGGAIPATLQHIQDLKNESAEGNKRAGGEDFTLTHFRRVWLAPVLLTYVFKNETTLRGGRVVPAGTKLRDLFPGGLYFCHVGKTVLDTYEQPIGSCWSHCPNQTGDGFHGLGSWDLIPLQEMKNELISVQFAAEIYDSMSPLLVRTNYVQGGKMPNKPGATVPVVNLPDEHPLSNVAMRVQPGNYTSRAEALGEQIAGSMQNRYGSFSGGGGGAPDVKAAGTATGIAILQEQSVGRMGPSLALYAETEVDRCYQILELRQKNWPEQMYETFDRKVGGDAGRWFRESDVRRDFRVEVVPQSWWPATEAQRRIDFSEYMAIAENLGVVRDPQIAKALFDRAGELYGRGIELERHQNDRVESRVRLERLRAVAEFLENESGVPVYDETGEPLPQLVGLALERAEAPLDAVLDRHDEHAGQLSEWLLTSEGRQASRFVRAVVKERIVAHFRAKAEQAQFFKTLQHEAAAPDKAAEIVSRQLDAAQAQATQAEQSAAELEQAEEAQRLQLQGQGEQLLLQGAAEGSLAPEEALAIRGEMRRQDAGAGMIS